ncbi:FAR1 DNA-binding domain protein [Sesbania bispinosa]|nr:FAR1 DNA-binding domain protein [Sesbania bispinosa]
MDGIFDCIVEENVTIEGFENMSVQFKDDGHERVDDSVESHVVFNDGSDGYFVNEEGIGVVLVDAEWEERNVEDNAHEEDEEVQKITINGFEDMKDMDLLAFSPHEIVKYEFANLEVATMFYTWYARVNGFAARKGKDSVMKVGLKTLNLSESQKQELDVGAKQSLGLMLI